MKGFYRPRNPQKYKGNPRNIVYRSSWEMKLMRYFDENSSILTWGSETHVIPYRSPIDGRYHRYFVDFYVKLKTKVGKIEEKLIEVKPLKQTIPPKKQNIYEMKKPNARRYLNEVMTYEINRAKWEACNKYCRERNWSFEIFTERELNIY